MKVRRSTQTISPTVQIDRNQWILDSHNKHLTARVDCAENLDAKHARSAVKDGAFLHRQTPRSLSIDQIEIDNNREQPVTTADRQL